jgi:hypothetical protein
MRPDKLSNRYADALEALTRAETRLSRAFTAWNKARLTARRYELELDKQMAALSAESKAELTRAIERDLDAGDDAERSVDTSTSDPRS